VAAKCCSNWAIVAPPMYCPSAQHLQNTGIFEASTELMKLLGEIVRGALHAWHLSPEVGLPDARAGSLPGCQLEMLQPNRGV